VCVCVCVCVCVSMCLCVCVCLCVYMCVGLDGIAYKQWPIFVFLKMEFFT
jgi:hypothetical protein